MSIPMTMVCAVHYAILFRKNTTTSTSSRRRLVLLQTGGRHSCRALRQKRGASGAQPSARTCLEFPALREARAEDDLSKESMGQSMLVPLQF